MGGCGSLFFYWKIIIVFFVDTCYAGVYSLDFVQNVKSESENALAFWMGRGLTDTGMQLRCHPA